MKRLALRLVSAPARIKIVSQRSVWFCIVLRDCTLSIIALGERGSLRWRSKSRGWVKSTVNRNVRDGHAKSLRYAKIRHALDEFVSIPASRWFCSCLSCSPGLISPPLFPIFSKPPRFPFCSSTRVFVTSRARTLERDWPNCPRIRRIRESERFANDAVKRRFRATAPARCRENRNNTAGGIRGSTIKRVGTPVHR